MLNNPREQLETIATDNNVRPDLRSQARAILSKLDNHDKYLAMMSYNNWFGKDCLHEYELLYELESLAWSIIDRARDTSNTSPYQAMR